MRQYWPVSVIEQLGFGPEERVVVVHVDDIGMCRAAKDGTTGTAWRASTPA